MTGHVIEIRFHEDLGDRNLNELRTRMETCAWKAQVRKARPSEDPASWDSEALDRLDLEYERIDLP